MHILMDNKAKHINIFNLFQLFLHKVFGYRGVVLFPWVGKVYDRDIAVKEER